MHGPQLFRPQIFMMLTFIRQPGASKQQENGKRQATALHGCPSVEKSLACKNGVVNARRGESTTGPGGWPSLSRSLILLTQAVALFFVIERLAVRTNLNFRLLAVGHDFRFVSHEFVVFGDGLDFDHFPTPRFSLQSISHGGWK